jgi:hypothetical protein
MKHSFWIALLGTAALAACDAPPVTTTSTTTTVTTAAAPREIVNQPPTAASDPSNCGTPTAPEACPPLPRHPLSTYPGSR